LEEAVETEVFLLSTQRPNRGQSNLFGLPR
jgi:hypothetical protein